MLNPLISVENVHKEITAPEGNLHILCNVNLYVNSSEAIAIVGASGSGKSTLLGLLAGLDNPTSGTIRVLQQELTLLNEDERAILRAGRIGFVFQAFNLLPSLTALENVMLPMELAGDRAARERATHVLHQVGLNNRLHHLPQQLSGGEQQRVALARAFAAQPQILFADEPTGNLDQVTGQRIIELLFNLRDHYGTALVLVTHDTALAQRCDRCYRLHEGQLQENPFFLEKIA